MEREEEEEEEDAWAVSGWPERVEFRVPSLEQCVVNVETIGDIKEEEEEEDEEAE